MILTNAQLERTRRLALRLTGIALFERHREILERRLDRLGIRDEAGCDALLNEAEDGDAAAVRRLIGLLTTNFSGFFRHPRHFDIAAEHALWAAHRHGAARIWSAAAATGEEPYSLAMALIEVFRRKDPPVMILATDIDEDALAIARRGEYGEPALRTLSSEQRSRFLDRAGDAGRWRVCNEVRDLVEFKALNIIDPQWPVPGPLEVIFCRNVLMYFSTARRYPVLERMASLLAPGGVLILDPAEHPGKAAHLYAQGANGVYPRRSESRNGRVLPAAGCARG